jgi:hypothetical protein
MKRLTYQTVSDERHPQHYCHGPGVKKDDLLQGSVNWRMQSRR